MYGERPPALAGVLLRLHLAGDERPPTRDIAIPEGQHPGQQAAWRALRERNQTGVRKLTSSWIQYGLGINQLLLDAEQFQVHPSRLHRRVQVVPTRERWEVAAHLKSIRIEGTDEMFPERGWQHCDQGQVPMWIVENGDRGAYVGRSDVRAAPGTKYASGLRKYLAPTARVLKDVEQHDEVEFCCLERKHGPVAQRHERSTRPTAKPPRRLVRKGCINLQSDAEVVRIQSNEDAALATTEVEHAVVADAVTLKEPTEASTAFDGERSPARAQPDAASS